MTHGADHTNGDRMDLGRRDGVVIVKGLVLGVQSVFLRRMDGMQLLRHFLFLLQKKIVVVCCMFTKAEGESKQAARNRATGVYDRRLGWAIVPG